MYFYTFFILFCIIDSSVGVIYKLNDTEYEQLPVLMDLEKYGACLENPGGIYCYVSLELHGTSDNKIYNLIQEYSEHYVKHFNYSRIERGVCVTRTCKDYIKNINLNVNSELEPILDECLSETMKQKYNLSSRLYGMSCDRQTDGGIKLDSLDYVVAAIIISLCLAVVIGSYYDYTLRTDKRREKGYQYLLCFSIFQNIEMLMPTEHGNNEYLDDLKGFNGLRVINEVNVIYGHALFFLARFISDPHNLEKVYENPFHRVFLSSTSMVQIFFFISGFLMSYSMQITSQIHHISWKSIPMLIFRRWWRLTPSLAVVLAIIVTWYRHMSSGPFWTYYITDGVTKECKEYFWAHIFFFNNFMINDCACLPQTWHIAADMQLFIIGLIVHLIIRNKCWRIKLGVLTTVILVGVAAPIAHVWLQDLDGFALFNPEMLRTLNYDTFRKYHILGYNNTPCFFIGMANGYIAYYLKQNKMKFPNFKLGNIFSWFTIPLIVSVFYVASFVYEDKERPSLTSRILFASCHRVIIGLILSVFAMGLILKFNGFSRSLLENRGWVMPRKLSYCVFLVHFEILNFLIGSRSDLIHVSLMNLLFIFVGVVFFSYLLAILLHLLVEAPSNRLMKILLGESNNKKKETIKYE